jgi:hypothetical protein
VALEVAGSIPVAHPLRRKVGPGSGNDPEGVDAPTDPGYIIGLSRKRWPFGPVATRRSEFSGLDVRKLLENQGLEEESGPTCTRHYVRALLDPFGDRWDQKRRFRTVDLQARSAFKQSELIEHFTESLILAQDERWRRA